MVTTFTEQEAPDADRPIAAESVAITAAQAAADDNPARAVMGTVDALTHPAARPSVTVGDVRARFGLG